MKGKHLVILMFLAAAFSSAGCQEEKKAAAPPPPPEVQVADVMQKDVPVYQEWVASMDGIVNATILAQVQGYLIKQNYKEGDFVKKGALLFEIDPRPFQAAVDDARAGMAKQQAVLQTAQANLKRILPLAAANAVSQRDKDNAIGSVQSAEAQVLSAQAQVRKAELDLGFTKIASPIDGIAGAAKAQMGDLVGTPQARVLTTVSTVNPIKAYVPLSEREYLKAVERSQQGAKADAEKTAFDLILADGSTWPEKGTFSFADRQVEAQTGTIRVAILFPNPGNLLRPGQFAKVRALMKTEKGAILVPQRAVGELQGSYQVAVVEADNTVRIRGVTVGERVGNLWVIREGLKPGERVVAEGTQKVGNGVKVTPKPFTPKSEA
ncbi:MAG TPA: efflux RND transporter periplasmic adaptor subunit [Desulfobacterales bacterium]|nr:efflux RND transporter periplasmic adaptor subunit [Desulfobacterales bacterium]HSM90701.1 efflux RND transporter periplasmic adaptor subunit [Desulfobacterales bacterium]